MAETPQWKDSMKIQLINITEHYNTLNSTKSLAENYIKNQKYNDHFLIIADEQINGVGRNENLWTSPKGGLWFSLVLNHLSLQKSLTLFIGYCVLKSLNELTNSQLFQTKWPNDIYLYNKKIAGIICSQYPQFNMTSINIGINTNCSNKELPETANSIKSALNITIDNELYLNTIISNIMSNLSQYESMGLPLFKDYYEKHDFLKNKYINIISGDKVHKGHYIDINNDGALLLKNDNDQIETVYAGSVSMF